MESSEVALCELGVSLLDALLMGGAPALVALAVKVEKVPPKSPQPPSLIRVRPSPRTTVGS